MLQFLEDIYERVWLEQKLSTAILKMEKCKKDTTYIYQIEVLR